MTPDSFIPIDQETLGEPALACPLCGNIYVHPVGLECRSPGSASGRVWIDANGVTIDPTAPPVGRGTLVTLKFMGECGHAFEYDLHFCKGNTLVKRRMRDVPRAPSPQTIWRD